MSGVATPVVPSAKIIAPCVRARAWLVVQRQSASVEFAEGAFSGVGILVDVVQPVVGVGFGGAKLPERVGLLSYAPLEWRVPPIVGRAFLL